MERERALLKVGYIAPHPPQITRTPPFVEVVHRSQIQGFGERKLNGTRQSERVRESLGPVGIGVAVGCVAKDLAGQGNEPALALKVGSRAERQSRNIDALVSQRVPVRRRPNIYGEIRSEEHT